MMLYIAGPMQGYPSMNHPAFMKAEKELQLAGYGIMNPARTTVAELVREGFCTADAMPTGKQWLKFDLAMYVVRADGLAVLPGWEASWGANIEFDVASRLSIPTLPVHIWCQNGQGGL